MNHRHRLATFVGALVAAAVVATAAIAIPPLSTYGEEVEACADFVYSDPHTGPPACRTPPDKNHQQLLDNPKYPKWEKVMGLQCKVTIYDTPDDIVRPPGSVVPPGQFKDPTAITWPTKDAQTGACECRIAIESKFLDAKWNPRLQTTPELRVPLAEKIAHELCHCMQAENGAMQFLDSKTGVAIGQPAGGDIETAASRCASEFLAGDGKKRPTLWDPKLQPDAVATEPQLQE